MSQPPITCLLDAKNKLGEGCLWDEDGQCLWWLDIAPTSKLHILDPATGATRHWTFPIVLTCFALANRNRLLIGGEPGLFFFDPATGALTDFARPEIDRPGNRGNDGAADARGRFWFGTMQQNIAADGSDMDITRDSGALYRVGADGVSKLMFDNVGVSNGPNWSPDNKTFYFSDTKNQNIYAFDFDLDSGNLSNQRIFNDSKLHGYPDGATVDADGFLWSARWDGSCIVRIDPKGRIDRVVEMPVTRPTCVVFGGPELDTIYVTSACANMPPEMFKKRPLEGGLFCFNPGVKGLPKHKFGAA
ncbi:SMP-30/gluconolactonase/LRE family protein [Aestuariivirga litoralis]|uniref:SMP-30/gluconolactonase/LRE family protein n=1 Tax=Aestuariivirga litoralis TaxID=2650924 RepID=UPI0018C773E0|nr:SMP-30/gluconolactonase/LRE family protein [Aestuariivirga litoralis]MBG1233606.1 SMP-30/gluconolactonase/LRE family protein [Aestuariivirga litoralis]